MRRTELPFATLALVGTLLLPACNRLQKPNDQAITSEIQSKLFQDSVLKTRDIRVASQQGVIVLTGTVETELEKSAAERLASQASGVKQVINQLGISATSASLTTPPESETTPASSTRVEPAVGSVNRRRQAASRHPVVADSAQPGGPRPTPIASTQPAEAVSRPVPEPSRITIPAGTVITVRTIDGIDSSRNHAGEEFAATVDGPVVVGDRVVIPRNSEARIRLIEARQAGHMTGQSELEVELVKVSVGNNAYSVETSVHKQEGASRGKQTAKTVGGGAGLGALIGAIAGKGKGAAIGAAVGAGAGTAVEAVTRGQQVRIPSETKLDFTVKTPFAVTL